MKELTELEKVELLVHHQCPTCHKRTFLKGPEGGLSINIKCENCDSKFNICPPHWAERI